MEVESSFANIIMGMVLILFIAMAIIPIINVFQNNAAYSRDEVELSGLDQLYGDVNATQENLKQITGEQGDQNFLTTMKNVITGKVLSLKDVYQIYRSFINNLLIGVGLGVSSSLVSVITIAITIFILLVIAMLILKVFL